MAISYFGEADVWVSSTSQGGAADPITLSVDCGTDSDRLLVVGLAYMNSIARTVSSCTYNGVGCTTMSAAPQHWNADSKFVTWGAYLEDPATGSNNLVVTLDDGAVASICAAAVFHGADTFGGSAGNQGAGGATHNVSITPSTTSDWIWAIIGERDGSDGAGAYTLESDAVGANKRHDGVSGGSSSQDCAYCQIDEAPGSTSPYTAQVSKTTPGVWGMLGGYVTEAAAAPATVYPPFPRRQLTVVRM